ncbi:thermonuclease family protein [Saccharococcus thermophilus]|uniref:Endonuclease YncB(Thermonuclease family) n=1 Tax=Saccharococcus thermophilus TaxID=29396 RepID=A0A846MIF8_9BACL|nr:thermonuclease family protein [Saccharococcus thermophilus]NIK14125.1 endonuclease YncB(thermonuclease family) [Saccharococcus thermophilus]
MKKLASLLVAALFTLFFSTSSFAHRGTLDELGGHFRNSDCMYLLHEPTALALQAKNKTELVQLIKKYNSNAKCTRQLTADKIDLEGHTLGGTSATKSGLSATLRLGEKYPATLVKCVDGDTAKFIVNGREYTTRFLFIDTPESTIEIEPFGKEASRFTCSRLKQGNITLETDGSTLFDKYHRLLAWVWVGNKLLQEEVTKAGLVEDFYDYGNYKYENRIRAAMAEAKRNGMGMYSRSSAQKSNSSHQQQAAEEKKKTEEEKTAPSPNSSEKNSTAKQDNQSKQSDKHPFLYLFIGLALAVIIYAAVRK